jgi:hypothetical protein
MTLDTKLVDCFSELTLDKNKINELFEIHQNELKKDETKQNISDETNDDTYDESYINEIKCNKCGKSSTSTTTIRNNQIKSNNRAVTTRTTSRSTTKSIVTRR